MKNRIIDPFAAFFLSIFVIISFCPGTEAAQAENNLSGTVEFFGHSHGFSFYVKPKAKWKELPEAVLEREISEIEQAGILDFLQEAFKERGISNNDFAKLLFVVSFVNSLEFEEDTTLRSLSQMVRSGLSNQPSRTVLAAALCQSIGLEAYPVEDNRKQYHLSVCFCKDARTDSMATNASFAYEGKTFYLVDPSLHHPIGMLPEEPGSSFRIIGESKNLSCISFFADSILIPDTPEDSSGDRDVAFYLNYENANYSIALRLRAHLRDYVSNLPLALPLFFSFAREEIEATGCVDDIRAYMEKFRTEREKVNFLLGIAQDSALCIYMEGPIRPTTITLFEAQADCDSRSQILAGLLLNLGFKRILVLTAKHHLTLALAPEDNETVIPGGKFIVHKNRKYYFLDPAIINGKWGMAIEANKWRVMLDLEKGEG